MAEPADLPQLERTLERLGRELEEARREMARLRAEQAAFTTAIPSPEPMVTASPAAAPVPPAAVPPPLPRTNPPPPRARAATPSRGFEQFIGRYGALSLAVLTIVMGAGALVSWALREGLLSPVVRVILGAVLAAALAAVGAVLRARGSRQFGHTLLALALAVVHVVAWGAGPRLDLVPAWLSLAMADAASLALVFLALRDASEQLFAVGIGGALIAPFVQHTGAANFVMLAAYGFTVMLLALYAVGGRAWKIVGAILVLAGWGYATALLGYHGDVAWRTRAFAPGFALSLALAAVVVLRPPLRPWIALVFAATSFVVGTVSGLPAGTPLELLRGAPDVALLAMAGTVIALYAARQLPERDLGWWIAGAAVLPLFFLLKLISALSPHRGADLGGVVHGVVALAWVLVYAAWAFGERGQRRGVLLAASGVVATWAVMLGFHDWTHAMTVACAGVAIVTAWVARAEERPEVLVATLVAGATGFAHGMLQLVEVSGFGAPFSTAASAALAGLMAGLVVAGRLAPDTRVTVPQATFDVPMAARVLIGVACFFWWRAELARAFSADAATFLLIVYYALCGVLVLWRGRLADSRRLRQTGLALSAWAALVALTEAFAVQQIALRVGSYLGVGAFLLGVAWWYREDAGRPAGEGPGASA